MKFGKYLAKRHLDLPEYANYFINYKALKKLINRLAGKGRNLGDGKQAAEVAYQLLQENKATFFFQLERELEKVQSFYRRKENDLELRLEILQQKKSAAIQAGTLARNSVIYISLYEGYQRFRRDLERLEQFIDLNGTGFSKVLKKWDKRSRSQTKELYLSRAVEVQPMFNREILVALSDKVNSSLLELEALEVGEKVVFEASNQFKSNPNDDLYYEFIKFASTYNSNSKNAEAFMKEWITQLTNTDNPRERFSHVFLQAVSTNAVDDALVALYSTGYVDIHVTTEISQKNCLHLAASTKNRHKVIELALQNGVSVTQEDMYGKVPLHYAAIHNRRDLIPKFLKAGANIDALDQDNFSPLHYAVFYNFSGFIEDLLDSGAKVTGDTEREYIPLNFACQYGSYDAVRIVLSKHADLPMVPDAEGLYPLHIVARAGFASIVPLLITAGADVNELDKLNSWTALMYAASEGHYEVVKVLLEAQAKWDLLDERGQSGLFYACWEGRPKCMEMLASILPPGSVDISIDCRSSQAAAQTQQLSNSLDEMDLESVSLVTDLDGIPDLSLPPPIIPLQRYGHNFLDSMKAIIQIIFEESSSNWRPVRFNEDRKALFAGRMSISASNSQDSIPRNIVLPVFDADRVQTFQADDLDKFSVDFEILPTYGTRVMAKTTALPDVFASKRRRSVLPMMNALLRCVGELEFTYLVVKPYAGKSLEIAKYDTYWKSTSYVEASTLAYPHGHGHAPNNGVTFQTTFAYVTASSLSGEYHKLPITLTQDLVPVVSDKAIVCNGVSLAVGGLKLDEVRKLSPHPIVTLEEALRDDSGHRQLNLDVAYPTRIECKESESLALVMPDMNVYADVILHRVFAHVRESHAAGKKPRLFMFTSCNPDLCAVFNWKQPNYPVFFCMNALRTDGKYTTANRDIVSDEPINERHVCVGIKDASLFAATNNLMGVIMPSDVLRLVPSVVSAVRVLGLLLVASGKRSCDIAGADAFEQQSVTIFPKAANS